jgi:hypothetical protein
MTNTIHALINSHKADNHVLFSLLFFLHFQKLGPIDINAPINQVDEDGLVIAVSLTESLLGIDTPDSYLVDRTKTVRQLSNEIRSIPKLSDSDFQKKLLLNIAGWRALVDMN